MKMKKIEISETALKLLLTTFNSRDCRRLEQSLGEEGVSAGNEITHLAEEVGMIERCNKCAYGDLEFPKARRCQLPKDHSGWCDFRKP